MTPSEIRKFLDGHSPEYRHIVEEAIRQEELHSRDPDFLGWEWHEVRAFPPRLVQLVVAGIIRMTSKTKRHTRYLLTDQTAASEALGPAILSKPPPFD